MKKTNKQNVIKTGRSKQVGLKDIAEKCGVSITTVSRFLRNDTTLKIKPELKQRISAVADYLQYTPNLTASMLRSTKTQTVAILGITDKTFSLGVNEEIISSAVRSLQNFGYKVILDPFHPDSEEVIRPLWRVDGFLFLHYSGMDQIRKNLLFKGIPFVSVNGVTEGNGVFVVPDDAGGMRLAIEHLFNLGHRKIAYIHEEIVPGKDKQMYHRSVRIRETAFFEIAAKSGIVPIIPETDFYHDPEGWLTEAYTKQAATAIIAYDHKSGLPAMQSALKCNLKVPEDLSIIMFNDFKYMQYMNPPVTTICLSADKLGETAAEELLKIIENPLKVPENQRIIEVAEKLVIRGSTCRNTKGDL